MIWTSLERSWLGSVMLIENLDQKTLSLSKNQSSQPCMRPLSLNLNVGLHNDLSGSRWFKTFKGIIGSSTEQTIICTMYKGGKRDECTLKRNFLCIIRDKVTIYCNSVGEVCMLRLCLVPGASRNDNHGAFTMCQDDVSFYPQQNRKTSMQRQNNSRTE